MTQRERVLAMLTEAGPAGVHSFVFFEERMPRAAAVVHKLRQDGYDIVSRTETLRGGAKGVRYFLRGRASAVPSPVPSAEPDGLFEAPRENAMFDPWSEAA